MMFSFNCELENKKISGKNEKKYVLELTVIF